MSTYGHFIVEVKNKDKWERLYWKSKRKSYPYLSEEESSKEEEDYVHEFVLVGNFYQFRDTLRDDLKVGDFSEDFSDETKNTLKKWEEENYGWNEGYFYLSDLDEFLAKKVKELEEYKNKNLLTAIYDKVREISAKLNNEEFSKPKNEENPFDEWYEEGLEWNTDEVSTLQYLSNVIYYIVDECYGYVDEHNIRVIVLGG